MKVALGIEYLGCRYSGWQKQEASPTIQKTLESALSEIANEIITVSCAGRTDAGVHAIQQVVHFETSSDRESRAWILGTNTKLPDDIAVTWSRQVDEDFHARFSAKCRTYQYLILNRRARPGILNGRVSWECRELNLVRMQSAARSLIGEHNFTSYRAVACQAKSPCRNVYNLDIVKRGEYFIMTVCANAFLHHMVRNIAGVLMTIGHGKEDVEWAGEVLAARDRSKGGVTASPDGLYLLNIQYPERFDIPDSNTLADIISLSRNEV